MRHDRLQHTGGNGADGADQRDLDLAQFLDEDKDQQHRDHLAERQRIGKHGIVGRIAPDRLAEIEAGVGDDCVGEKAEECKGEHFDPVFVFQQELDFIHQRELLFLCTLF